MTSKLNVAVSIRCATWRKNLPEAAMLCRRAAAEALTVSSLTLGRSGVEVSIVLADDAFVRGLNRDYRGRDEATNVLSFPTTDGVAPISIEPASDDAPVPLGDVIVALETVGSEAADQEKPPAHHLSHLIVHGVLHLVGYRHDSENDAEVMETLETEILSRLGVPDPYTPRTPATTPATG